jgi:hypothetical protein
MTVVLDSKRTAPSEKRIGRMRRREARLDPGQAPDVEGLWRDRAIVRAQQHTVCGGRAAPISAMLGQNRNP